MSTQTLTTTLMSLTLLAANSLAGVTWKVPQQVSTINGAVALAGNGDEILISKGVYDENVVITSKSDLTLRGAGRAVIAPASGLAIDASNCPGLVLKKLTIKTVAAFRSIQIVNGDDTRIQSCRVDADNGNNSPAIYLQSGTGHQVIGNRFEGNFYSAISLAASDSLISKNKVAGAYAVGIRVSGDGNAILDNRVTGASLGIALDDGSDQVLIAGNRVLRATGTGAIFADNTTATMIIDNKIVKPGGAGIFSDDPGGLVAGNVIKKPGGHGIRVRTNDTAIIGNRVDRSAEDGIHVYTGSGGQVHRNRVRRSGQNAFYINGQNLDVTGNLGAKSWLLDLLEGPQASGNVYLDNRFEKVSP